MRAPPHPAAPRAGTDAGGLEKTSPQMVKLTAFQPFANPAMALEEANSVSEGIMTEWLKEFLERELPKAKKGKANFSLGVLDAKLGAAIQDGTGIPCQVSEPLNEIQRGVRQHLPRFVKDLEEVSHNKAQLGLAHAYSRAKVKFNVNKVDNMIMQAIALLDVLDKDINTFIMRVREWYGWHFPELVKIVADNYLYARVAMYVKNRADWKPDMRGGLGEVLADEDKAAEVEKALNRSMGQDISPIDLVNIQAFAQRVIDLAEYRQKLHEYLLARMHTVAPNLSALIGETVGARLIQHAGSLTNLAKYPASTVQILGAEKALFRALKTKGNTPKYGLIFHSSFIGRAKARNKGRISRYLANKCSIASRIDAFSEATSSVFGEAMKGQVEERLRFYEEGVPTKKNTEAMKEAMEEFREANPGLATPGGGAAGGETPKSKKKSDKKKRKRDGGETPASGKKEKKDKKDKKSAKKSKKDK